MATLAPPSPPTSPSSFSRRRKTWARRAERYCCNVITYFPLVFVSGLTTWAVWVEAGIGFLPANSAWTGYTSSAAGALLYFMLNWSYFTAVFTDPGSPLGTQNGYSHLPTQESRAYTSFTVKQSTGDIRYCKKCQTKKPDRAHHCSTCRRCVLKMDHHCPWLATCVGLRNYKPFLLFLVYLSLFCWLCFAVSATWVWSEILSDTQFEENLMPVNYVLLAVISGIIGLVITGFTAWHVLLTLRGQTTIENLEKVRYLSPLKRSMQRQLEQRNYTTPNGRPSISDQLREIHANALPGVTRPEEGEERSSFSSSPAQTALRNNWTALERAREQDRYLDYLEEQDNAKLPNAFDLGWKRNFLHVLGPVPTLWFLPVCNTTGDGWQWDASEQWVLERERIIKERDAQLKAQKERERAAGWGTDSPPALLSPPPDGVLPPRRGLPVARPGWGPHADDGDTGDADHERGRWLTTSNGVANVPREGRRSPNKADLILGRSPGMYYDSNIATAIEGPVVAGTPLQTLARPPPKRYRKVPRRSGLADRATSREQGENEDEGDEYESSSDEEGTEPGQQESTPLVRNKNTAGATISARPRTENWNDVPEDMLASSGSRRGGMTARSRARDEWTDWDAK